MRINCLIIIIVIIATTFSFTATATAKALNNNWSHKSNNLMSNKQQLSAALEYARICGKLKETKRTGWVKRHIPNPESVADHSWRVAALCYLFNGNNNDDDDVASNTDDDINVSQCVQLAVVHDLAEAIVGDIAPCDGVSKVDKHRMELEAMEYIATVLANATSTSTATQNQNLMALYNEYEKRESKESIVVKDLDLLDMIIQADEYEINNDETGRSSSFLQEFFDGTGTDRFKTPQIRLIAQELHRQRIERLKNNESKSKQNNLKQKKDINDILSTLSIDDQEFVTSYAVSAKVEMLVAADIISSLRKRERERDGD